MNKYKRFDNFWMEIENFGVRGERFYEEMAQVDDETVDRMVQWLKATWEGARMQVPLVGEYDE